MDHMDPQQELFTLIRTALVDKFGENMVFDGFLPPEGTEYPFFYIADSQLIDNENKTAVFGTISQTIHIWHNNPMKRGDVSALILDLKGILRSIKGNACSFSVRGIDQRILADNITTAPLLHGIVVVDFNFS